MSKDLGQYDLADAAVVFARMQSMTAFSARDFAAWVRIGGHEIEEEDANEILLAEVEKGRLREIGPAVYALKINGTQPDMECRKCDTRYVAPPPTECDYCGTVLVPCSGETPLQRSVFPEETGR